MGNKFRVIVSILMILASACTEIAYLKESWTEPRFSPFCTECALVVNRFLALDNETVAIELAINTCLQLGLGNDVVCEGVVTLNEPALFYIYENSPNLTGKDVCSVVFGQYGCKSDNPDRVWEVKLPDTTKPSVDEPPLAGPLKPTLKVLHLTDTHYDPQYYPGADTANCLEEYLCCREISGIAADPRDGAGFWGDYRNCDIPRWSLEAVYDHISKQYQDIDFILWTGDLIPHDVWNTSRESNLAIINEMADLISQYFPSIPVFPAIGNHESHPADLFPQPYITDPEFDISWLYDELNTIWQRWLPPEVTSSIAYGGYYTTQIRPGLRVLSINTQFCSNVNFWLLLDSGDIANQLEMMALELQDAEDKGEYVYIIGHIPAGNADCLMTWSHEFNRVVSRYESTISGLFYGHTHKDHFQLYFDPSNSSRVYEIAYIGQSQTTHTKINPGYKVYIVEGDFNGTRYRVIDHENWAMDLTASNAFNETVFLKLYSAKEYYNLTDLSPQSWLEFVYEMNEPNSTLFNEFYRNYVKAGTLSLIEGCDDECKTGTLCTLLVSDNSDHSHCDILN